MAPTKEKAKEKTKKASGDDATEMILHYLRKQNRPYSATDISANLHNKVTKSAAAKILKDLHERQQIEGRAAGKQLVYHPIQDASAAASAEDLAAIDTKTESLREETAALRSQADNLRAELATLNKTMSTIELKEKVASLESEHSGIVVRLQKLRNGDVQPISKEEKARIEAELGKWAKVEKSRKRIHKEMWSICKDYAEPMGQKTEDLQEELAITDV